MASVTFENVVKRYGNVTAVSNLSLEIPDKEFLVFVGPSGCGKSTSLRMLAGLEDISEGTIYIGERPVNDVPPKDRDIAMVFQSYALYPHMSVYDNMAFALKLRAKTGRLRKMFTAVFARGQYKKIKEEEADIDRRVKNAAKILGIEQLLPRKPRQLSGGQRQRVAVGRAIVREPKVFLFDEPLSNLDAKLRVQTRAEITKLHQQLATTFIYVTHDQMEAMTMGTRIAVMKDGLLQQVDSPQKLYDYPDNMFVAGFIGSPSMNFFEVTVKGTADNVEVEGDGFKLAIPAARAQGLKNYIGKQVFMGLRPEDIYDAEYVAPNIHPGNVDAKVEVTELMGNEVFLYLLTGGHSYVARVDPRTKARVGNDVRVVANLDNVHFFEKDTPDNRALR
ncbi:MAG TPA: ABC transporter ATP-binding protein [Anaerolineae bacterium]|nr:ABC transporter ATP-binding protein [Anaerolineae bacterium]